VTRLSAAASFWVAAGVIALGQWGGAAPSVLYPIYAARWHLSPTATTTIFAVYPTALVIVLLLFGGISDVLGRRFAMLTGVSLIALGAILFAVAPSEAWLYLGRIIQGAGTGISVGAASAALVDFNGSRSVSRASAVNTMGSSAGLLGASIVSGALVQYIPWPTHLTFVVLIGLSLVLGLLVAATPRHDRFDHPVTADPPRMTWRPRPIAVPRGTRGIFVTSALAIFTGLGLGAIILSLGAQISKDLIHTHNVFVQGLVLAISSAVIGVSAILFRPFAPRVAIIVGCASGAAALAVLVPSSFAHSLPLYIASQILGGGAIGLTLLGGVGLIQRGAAAHHRGSLISAFYLVGYLGQGIVSTVAGLAATAWGLQTTILVFSPVLGVFGLAVIIVAAAVQPRVASPSAPAPA
jgi:MFS family permease